MPPPTPCLPDFRIGTPGQQASEGRWKKLDGTGECFCSLQGPQGRWRVAGGERSEPPEIGPSRNWSPARGDGGMRKGLAGPPSPLTGLFVVVWFRGFAPLTPGYSPSDPCGSIRRESARKIRGRYRDQSMTWMLTEPDLLDFFRTNMSPILPAGHPNPQHPPCQIRTYITFSDLLGSQENRTRP